MQLHPDKQQPDRQFGLQIVGVTLVVLVSRVPFIGAGYGLDPDAWRVARAARQISITGAYTASRLPGYPVQELICSVVWSGGPLALNAITALLSAVSAAFLALSFKKLGGKDWVLAGLAFAFVPVIYINSTNAMDYIWALSFILASYFFVLQERPLLAGALLGLAIGCRITSGAMLLPFSIAMLNGREDRRIQDILVFVVSTLVSGSIVFLPVFVTYRFGFFTFYEPTGYPGLSQVVRKASIDVWGRIGILALILSSFSLVIPRRSAPSLPSTVKQPIVFSWVLALILYTISYFRLPHEAGYLIPAVPFVLLLLARYLRRTVFVFLCMALIMSSFLVPLRNGRVSADGPIMSNHRLRLTREQLLEHVILRSKETEEDSMIVAGYYLPQIEVLLPLDSMERDKFIYLPDEQQIIEAVTNSRSIYYLPGQDTYNNAVHGYDLQDYGGSPLLVPNGK